MYGMPFVQFQRTFTLVMDLLKPFPVQVWARFKQGSHKVRVWVKGILVGFRLGSCWIWVKFGLGSSRVWVRAGFGSGWVWVELEIRLYVKNLLPSL